MVMFEAFRGLHPAGCNLDSHEEFKVFSFIRLGLRNLSRLIQPQTFGHFRQRVTHQALPTAMVMFEAFGGLHPAGCNLDSHEEFKVFSFIRLGLRNLPRLIQPQTFGHFRQRVTHQALPTAMVMFEAFRGLHPAGCNLDSHEEFKVFSFIRLGLRNLSRLIQPQTFGHFRQRVTHQALHKLDEQMKRAARFQRKRATRYLC